MTASLESLTQIIACTPAAEASLYSLSYIAALQQCAVYAYQSTLAEVTSSTGSSGVCGDSFTECCTRLRLETERRVAGQLRTALLQELAAARARERDGAVHARFDDVAEAATSAQGEGVGNGGGGSDRGLNGASSGRRRASSVAGGGGSNNPSGKLSRRSSQRPSSSSAAGLRNSLQPVGMNAPSLGGTRGSEEGVPATATPVNMAMAVRLLREGLARAFDWPLPSSSLFADGKQSPASHPQAHSNKQDGCGSGGGVHVAQLRGLADTLLSQRAFAPVIAATGSTPTRAAPPLPVPATPPLYMEPEDEEGRRDILLEWMEDMLVFALHLHFNAPQTQCLLLDSLVALQVLEGTDAGTPAGTGNSSSSGSLGGEDGAEFEKRVAEALQDVLRTQTCPTVTRVIETVQQRQPVVREVPDPVQLAELEQKRMKATTQKALAALDAAQASIPLVRQTFMEDVSVEVEKDAMLPAVFSMAEAAAMVEFITRSTVMHRHLWQLVLRGTSNKTAAAQLRPVVEVPLCAYVEDIPPVFLPPLTAFYPARLQGEVDGQRSLFNDCAAEKERAFSVKYEMPLAALSAEAAAARQALVAAAQLAAAEDRDAAMTSQECAHVEKAFELRLHDAVAHNAHLSRNSDTAGGMAASAKSVEKAKTEAVAAAALSASAPEPVKRKGKSSGAASPAAAAATTAATRSVSTSNLLGQSMLSAEAAAAVPLPAGAVFTLAEVERRVDRIAAAAENVPTGGAAGAAGRGGPRKR